MLQISFLRSQCLYLSDLYAFPLFVASMIRWMRPGFEVVNEDVSRKVSILSSLLSRGGRP